jgi:two-component system CheB/CheR fusion protein
MKSNKCCGTKCTLLIADDNEEFLVPLQLLLEANGCTVIGARSGSEVLALAAKLNFDALILDIRLSDLSGFTVVGRLRMLPAFARVPIIGLTGWHSPSETFALEAGFDYFFLKPVNFDQLKRILNERVCRADPQGHPVV